MEVVPFVSKRLPKRTRDETLETRTTHNEIVRHVLDKPEHSEDCINFDDCARVCLFASIALFTLNFALKPTKKQNAHINVNTATDDVLIERLKNYDQIDDKEQIRFFRNKDNWISFAYNGVNLFCIKEIGEIVDSTGVLLGSCINSRISTMVNKKHVTRSHLVLFACGHRCPSETHTADHIDPMRPSCDSITNLRWASKSEQRNNQVRSGHAQPHAIRIRATRIADGTIRTFEHRRELAAFLGVKDINVKNPTKIYKGEWLLEMLLPDTSDVGRILPPHPIHKNLQLSENGFYKADRGAWRHQNGSRPVIGGCGLLSRLTAESILGRNLDDGGEVDHMDGDTTNNKLSNLWPVSRRINTIKKFQSFVISTDTDGHNKLYLSPTDAHNSTGVAQNSISNVCNGTLKTAGGRSWRIASVDELTKIFQLVETRIAQLSWDEKLQMLETYKEDKYYSIMRDQLLLSREFFQKRAAWELTAKLSA